MLVAGAEIGTQSAKVVVLDNGRIAAVSSSFGYKPDKPSAEASRQDPAVWRRAFRDALRKACRAAGTSPKDIGCVAVGGQMHGFVPGGPAKREA